MHMNRFLLMIIFTFGVLISFSQEYLQSSKNINPIDSIYLNSVPKISVPDYYLGPNAPLLPAEHDNSTLPFFRTIFSQFGWSCGQASTIGYNFTYELNRIRNLNSSSDENLYPPVYTFNFFNHGEDGVGVCFLYTYDAIKHNGNPNVEDYGGMGSNLQTWVTGYDTYYNGMLNKVDKVSSIYVGDDGGIDVLKNWLTDHLDGSTYGSLANFYTDLSGYTTLPPGTPEEGKNVVTQFGSYSGHSLTIIGWNDSIRYDYNLDGQYTNDIDINGDGLINMKDWEIGGMKFANSWGENWADSGFCYVMYKVLAEEKADGGIWNKSCYVIDVKEDYEPLITYKLKVKHNIRNKLRFIAGVSSDTSAIYPEHILDFPIFNYQGGPHFMQGNDTIEEHRIIEVGMDVTPLLSYIQNQQAAKFFFQIHEHDPQNEGNGEIMDFSIMDYTQGGMEITCDTSEIAIINNTYTTLYIIHEFDFDKVSIDTDELPPFETGLPYSYQLAASGGKTPYEWELAMQYNFQQSEADYPDIQGEQLTPNGTLGGFATQNIDFPFPFYNKQHDSITVHIDGFLMFNEIKYPLPYQVNDQYLFKYEPMLAAFLNKQLRIQAAEDGLWYEGDATYAAFRWKLTLVTDDDDIAVDFSTILYPDGKIEYYFNIPEIPYPVLNITGISNGDGISYEISDFSNLLQSKSQPIIKYSPQHFLSEMSVDNSGLLSASPMESDKIYSINVRVTDDNNISSIKSFQLSDGLIYSYTILSGDDSQIDFGETAYLSFEITNISSSGINDVELNMDIDDPYVTLLDHTENIGLINAGQTISISDAISFEVASNIPNKYKLSFETEFISELNSWNSFINLQVYAPLLRILSPIIDDEDGMIDPGETLDLIFPVFNYGQSTCYNVEGLVDIDDQYITFNGTNLLVYGDIEAGNTNWDTLSISADESTPMGHTIDVDISITAEPDLVLNKSFSYMIGKIPVLVIDLDPELLSGPIIKTTLEQLDVVSNYLNEIPDNLDQYYNIFVILGRNFSNYNLSESEGQLLADYLLQGGNLYLEGGLTWNDFPQTAVHPLFNLNTESLTWTVYSEISGVEDFFTEGMLFEYEGEMQYYNYNLLPTDSSFSILYGNTDHNYAIAFAGNIYKTIGTTIDFGGLVDNNLPSTRKYLLAKILEFFGMEGVVTSVAENPDNNKDMAVHIAPNPMTEQTSIGIFLEDPEQISLTICDIQGRIISIIAEEEIMTNGKHNFIWNAQNVKAGVYLCFLKTSSSITVVKIIKSK